MRQTGRDVGQEAEREQSDIKKNSERRRARDRPREKQSEKQNKERQWDRDRKTEFSILYCSLQMPNQNTEQSQVEREAVASAAELTF